jgi:hypothetical protein
MNDRQAVAIVQAILFLAHVTVAVTEASVEYGHVSDFRVLAEHLVSIEVKDASLEPQILDWV